MAIPVNPLPQQTNQATRAYNPIPQSPRIEARPEDPERIRALLPTALNVSEDEVDNAIQLGAGPNLEQQARARSLEVYQQYQASRTESIINEATERTALGEEVDKETILTQLTEAATNDPIINRFINPVDVATVFQTDNELAQRMVFDKFAKVSILSDLLYQEMQRYDDTTWLRTGWEFVDSMVAVPVYSNVLAAQRSEMAGRITRLIAADVPMELFETEIKQIIRDAAAQGLLTGDNRFFLQDLISLLPEGGEGPEAMLQSTLATFDTLAGVGTLAASASRGLLRAGVSGLTARVTGAATDASTLVAEAAQDGAQRAANLIGRAAATDNPRGAVNPVGHAPSGVTPLTVRSTYLTAPEHQALLQQEQVNPYLATMVDKFFGTAIDDDLVRSLSQNRLADLRNSGRAELIDVDVYQDGLNNLFQVEQIGTKAGKDFISRSNAQRVANERGGEVIQVGPNAWRVSVEVPLALGREEVFRMTNVDNLGRGFWARWGSPQSQTDDFLTGILMQSEAGRSALQREVVKEIKKLKKALPLGSRRVAIRQIDAVFNEINYGRWAAERNPMTATSFEQKFRELHGRMPTPNETEFALGVQQLNNVDYYLKADPVFKDVVNRGYQMADYGNGQGRLMSRKVEATEVKDPVVWDVDKGEWVDPATLPTNKQIYELGDELFELPNGDLTQYVAGSKIKTRRVFHSDVLPYNPGGPRRYMPNEVKFFVKQNQTKTVAAPQASGTPRTVSLNPRTFAGVKLEKEAMAMRDQVNKVIEAIHQAVGRKPQKDQYTVARTVASDPNVRRVLEANNDWNPSIQTVDDFIQFFEDNSLSVFDKVDYASDGAEIGNLLDAAPLVNGNMTLRDAFRVQQSPKKGRSDDILISYGGNPNRVMTGMQTIERSLLSSVAIKSETSYLLAATQGLVKAVVDAEMRGMKPLAHGINMTELQGKTQLGQVAYLLERLDRNTEVGSKLWLEAKKIGERLNTQDILQPWFDKIQGYLSDRLYDSFGNNAVSRLLDRHSANPVAFAKSIAFDNIMGLFAYDQLYVQASQVFAISAMKPQSGPLGAALYPIVRGLVINGNKNVAGTVGQWIASKAGLTPQQFEIMVDMLRNNGRLVADLSVAELGEAASSGVIRSIRQAGRFFFNEGEFVARITAHNAAFIDYVKRFPNADLTSQTAQRAIMKEADKLTQHMTGASQNWIQKLPLAQFLGYSWHFTEQIFSGWIGGGKRILSAQEKARLATVQAALFGASGLGLGHYVDQKVQDGTLKIDGSLYTAVRYGFMDVALSNLIGTDTAIGNRLGVGQGIVDFASNLLDKNIIEAFTGASGQSATTIGDMLIQVWKDIKQGEVSMGLADLNTLARQIKSYELVHNAATAFMFGSYYARNGSGLVDDDVSAWDAVALAWGIPLQEVLEAGAVSTSLYHRSQRVGDYSKRVGEIYTAMLRAIESGDQAAATDLNKTLTTTMAAIYNEDLLMGEQVSRNLRDNYGSRTDRVYMNALRNGIQTVRLGE